MIKPLMQFSLSKFTAQAQYMSNYAYCLHRFCFSDNEQQFTGATKSLMNPGASLLTYTDCVCETRAKTLAKTNIAPYLPVC